MTRWLPVMFGIGIAIWVVALGLLAVTAGDSTQFGLLQPWLLMVNIVGLVVLLALIGGRLADLVRDRRGNVPGSRLRTRHVLMLCSLVLAPLLLVFTFSVVFLTRGIDSWFHVEVRQGLSDALGLSRAALDLRMREYLERTARIAEDLQENRSALLFAALDTHRRLSGAEELAIVSSGGRIDAFSADGLLHAVPVLPAEEMLVQARSGQPYVSLDPAAEGGYLIRAAVGMDVGRGSIQSPRVLVAVYPVPQRLADLAEAVQGAYQQYGQLSYLREPLKLSFVLTLSLVLLVALLAAVYAAFYFTDRLVRPVQDLIGATRAVAKGDFDTRLPRPSHDEIGYLVTSFNDMTKRLARARAEADRSRQAVESERTSLAVILARLSTGVISLAPDLTIRIANHAASGILGADLEAAAGPRLDELTDQPLVAQLAAAVSAHVAAGQTEWREQLSLRPEGGRRELMCACTALPGEDGKPAGLVLVFDDITQLLHAQREAAWGEVARRLAHEIKNPLTPIQLSAERMRRRLLPSMAERDAELLDRATHTIVQQVEAMKQMVNAFSEYARAPAMELAEFDLNALVREVGDLYRAHEARVRFRLELAPGALGIHADRGRIRQVLNNLLTNSIEALEGVAEPEITVETRRAGAGLAELEVRDNGPGFQREFIDQVFDPYVTSKPKGTGLGLAIVRKIVDEHGGRIEADNGPQVGARVRLWLPTDEAARPAPAPRETRRTEPRREHA